MHNKNISEHPSVFSVALFVTGATVGAGLLALPVQTGLAGTIPSVIGFFLAWGLMLSTGFVLSDNFADTGQSIKDLPSLFELSFGQWSKWIVIPSYLLVFYGVMVAYLCGSGSVLTSLFNQPSRYTVFLLLFFVPSTMVVLAGLKFIHRANFAFMVLLLGSFIVLMWLASSNVKVQHYRHVDWFFLLGIFIILMSLELAQESGWLQIHQDVEYWLH